MRVLNNVVQGSERWHEERSFRRCASEAPAMLGLSKYVTRSELLRLKAGGEPAEASAHKQALFDRGHEAEAAARVIAEELLGDELYPCTVVSDDGLYLASLDGLTDDGQTLFEHKLYSADLAGMVVGDSLSPEYLAQIDHQMMVTGATRCMFMVSDGTKDFCCWMWVERNEERIAALRAGWDQFALDLANYAHREAEPVAVGVSPENLPALRIEVTGMVTQSNLREFKTHALAVFEGINTDLQTDSDFANAEKTVKWCADIESRLDAAKQHALSQTASIDELFRAIDQIKEIARAKRLELDKLVRSRKDSIRAEIMAEGAKALTEHHIKLAARIGASFFPVVKADFAGAMKGKRTIDSLRDAVATTLAHAKIAANELADRMHANLQTLRGSDHASLFPDAEALAVKPAEDVVLIMIGRIAKAKAEADRRAEEARERIRREEEAKAQKVVALAAAEREATVAPAAGERERTVPPADGYTRHRAGIKAVIAEALTTEGHMSAVTATKLVEAIAAGRIPHLTINYQEVAR